MCNLCYFARNTNRAVLKTSDEYTSGKNEFRANSNKLVHSLAFLFTVVATFFWFLFLFFFKFSRVIRQIYSLESNAKTKQKEIKHTQTRTDTTEMEQFLLFIPSPLLSTTENRWKLLRNGRQKKERFAKKKILQKTLFHFLTRTKKKVCILLDGRVKMRSF